MKPHIIACLECHRVKLADGSWDFCEIDTLRNEVSHTYCNDCMQSLQSRLLALREFTYWDFNKKLEYLRREISQSPVVFDKQRLSHHLEEFYNLGPTEATPFLEALSPLMVPAVCGFCHQILPDLPKAEKQYFGEFQIHASCKKSLMRKMETLSDNDWIHSEQLDAYMDMLQIPQCLRNEVRHKLSDFSFS